MKAKNYIVQMVRDEDPMNPREMCDTPSHMVCKHRNYNFGGGNNDEEGAVGIAFSSPYTDQDCFLAWVFSAFIETSDIHIRGTVQNPMRHYSAQTTSG